MKKILTKLKPFVPAIIMFVIILIMLFLVFSFGVNPKNNSFRDPQQVYIQNKDNRNKLLIISISLDVVVMAFYLLEVKFRKTILKWILFNVSIFMMIASCFIFGLSLSYTTCSSLLLLIGMPFFNFCLFIVSFVFACIFLKQQKKLDL